MIFLDFLYDFLIFVIGSDFFLTVFLPIFALFVLASCTKIVRYLVNV